MSSFGITAYHARYFANEISCRRTDDNRLSQSLFDAKVDLNPHQIDAALFALKNPLQEGVLLADEVGLGKTIEAGLVLCQMWAERKRKLLIVCPAILRKQWANELAEKFNLPTLVVDKVVVVAEMRQKSGSKLLNFCKNHLEQQVMIVSHQYATKEMTTFKQFDWDLVVIDEAHKMRNAYKTDNKMGKAMRQAFGGKRKLLLTATPLQNSLMELYGLSTLLDEHLFGDKKFFQKEFVRKGNLSELKSRMAKFIKRTLRKNVLEYVRYTERKTITQEFMPSDAEQQLYEAISDFLHKETIYALPKQHKHLTALILRKLLASSPQAVLGTLRAILDRLLSLKQTGVAAADLEVVDELLADEGLSDEDLETDEETQETEGTLNQNALDKEIREIESFIRLAESLAGDSKLDALLKALQTGFGEMAKLGAAQKAIIFTESVRTQHYLYDFLLQNGYADQVVMFSGTNNDAQATQIYHDWLARNVGTEKVTGSVDVDKRSALIEHFRENAQIMIATEAASEGVNLQFCSLLINYDLPWNPQRVEQRIGRCHRYGQKFDVVVVNFLNKRNLADQRVLELLTEKFKLFQGVLGASDEVLGQIESGVDIENQIANIYATCRTEKEIQHAFDELQAKFADKISDRMKETQEALVERFDQSVLDRLKVMARERLSAMEQWFWGVTQFALADKATFNHSDWYFLLKDSPVSGVSLGRYLLPKKTRSQQIEGLEYRLNHPLGGYCIQTALAAVTPAACVVFDYTHYPEKISLLERYQGQSGWLKLDKICVTSPVEKQDALVFSICDQQGNTITDEEFTQKLFSLPAQVQTLAENQPLAFNTLVHQQLEQAKLYIKTENDALLKTEMLRIQAWAKDQMQAAEDLISEIKEDIREKEREILTEDDINRQIDLQETITKLRRQLRKARNELEDVQEEIEEEEMRLLKALRAKTQQTMDNQSVFLIQWKIL
ncbi:SNF2-related protein [Aggregatibacter actinomycetemcomitans]|uniref:SNF2-related protein n=1 Tax=Aggregatibacter actinomycetemcomitans TaxID=714 RepID=UPI00023FEBC3|nr:SNF2-related protein [Aggregatibacter actinomycetemcomitans]EHK89883.1 ATP-dependent helicase [Aggregatibacter actinomycetemcomitans RhAA1]KNE76975.1 ATP-dependent helicase [Aggregatibacter actinomycetemcomitans RhAA1]MBN6080410.1 DEAD/DEAH box helicase [Aggregatibacter actinomycetemcomitans]